MNEVSTYQPNVVYEDKTDRSNQDRCQWQLEYRGWVVKQTPTLGSWDFELHNSDGDLQALAEYKFRKQWYNEIVLGIKKADKVIDKAQELGCYPLFIVETPDTEPMWTLLHTGLTVRCDFQVFRGDPPEDVYMIPRNDFNIFQDRG